MRPCWARTTAQTAGDNDRPGPQRRIGARAASHGAAGCALPGRRLADPPFLAHVRAAWVPPRRPTTPPPSPGGYADTPGYDSEGKALSIKRAFWGRATPHTVAFHLAWISFMVAFWSSFAPAALITSIKNDLKLTKAQIADANVAAVCGGVVARLFIGKFMDSWGPRYAFMLCLWATAPAVFAMSKVTSSSTSQSPSSKLHSEQIEGIKSLSIIDLKLFGA